MKQVWNNSFKRLPYFWSDLFIVHILEKKNE